MKHISEKGSAGWAKAKEGSGIGEGTAAHIAREQACDARERNSTRAMPGVQVRGGGRDLRPTALLTSQAQLLTEL